MNRRLSALAVVALLAAAGCANQAPGSSSIPSASSSAAGTASPATSTDASGAARPASSPSSTGAATAATSGAAAARTPAAPRSTRSAKAQASAQVSQQVSSGAIPTLPEKIGAWTKVEQDTSNGWIVGGYNHEMAILTLRGRNDGTGDAEQLVTQFSKGRYVPISGVPCASGPTVRACAQTKGRITVLITTTDLETEELAPLVGQALTQVK